LLKNKDLMLVAITYGIGFGRGDTISTLLDQTMHPLYPGNGSIIGVTGCLIILSGALGVPVWGRILDKTRAYKKVNVILSISTAFSLICLAYATIYLKSVPLVYLSAILFGFFQTGFMVTNLELAIEITYPAPELVTVSLLNMIPSASGPLFILIGSFIVDKLGPLATNIFYLITVFIALACVICTTERLKRNEAAQQVSKTGI
jgi:FLVCR family feline leukemia virus subgroup C receptor-related protein